VKFLEIEFTEIVQEDLERILHRKPLVSSIIVTPNMDFLMRYTAKVNLDFNKAIDSADYTICDSRILKSLAALKGTRLPTVITGSDLTSSLISNPKISNLKTLFIGPTENEFNELKVKYSLNNVKNICPPFGYESDTDYIEKLFDEIVEIDPELVFIALGSPKQEQLSLQIKNLNIKANILCIGASLDFLSGKAKRAPLYVSKLHLEWLYRLLSEPTRMIKRYSANLKFLCKILIKRELK
jgi:exopolysaccharide biosynthesis WecB/TagA/CpsF family protein